MSGPHFTSTELAAAFPLGSSVRYSQKGREWLRPRVPDRIGIVEGYCKAYTKGQASVCGVRVRWPDRKTPDLLRRDFIELVPV